MVQDTPAPFPDTAQKHGRGHLLRVLGFGFGLAVIIGNTIGAGILRGPGTIAAQLPNTWLFLSVWLGGGLYALLGAVSIAELGAMIPRSGGQYIFARYALGEYAGFIVGWSDWISTCGSTAAISLVLAGFTGALFPALSGNNTVLGVAAGATIVFALLQWRGIVLGSLTQNITSLLKALAFVTLIAAAFIFGGRGAAIQEQTQSGPVGFALLVAIVLSLQTVIYTYDGWTGVVYFSEEVKDPGRDVPRSMIGGVLSVIAIYLLVNLALLYVLPVGQIAGKDFAAGFAAQVLFGSRGDTVFRVLTIVSMLSAINACQLMATRVLFAMSRDGLLSQHVANVNRGGTPAVALFLSTAVPLVFIVFGQTFEKVITIVAFFFVAAYSLSFISVFVLRWREPDKPRPYRAWGYPWTTGIVLLGSILFLAGAVASDTRNSVYALLLLAVSYPVFLLLKRLA
ncbi:MAG TPA: APC family permease [Pyrinomonadaceae bacterium]|nr:APC family permease [Pyrinomonadaceae bacterium]